MATQANQTAAVVPEFLLTYEETCPGCKAEGVTSALGLVDGRGIVCAAGLHDFERLPSEGEALPEDSPAPGQAAPAASSAARSSDRLNLNDVCAAPAGGDVVANSPGLVCESSQLRGEYPSVSAAIPPAGQTAEPRHELGALDPRSNDLEFWQPVGVGGGRVAVLVELSESHFGALRAEAEAQGRTFAEFFQTWMQTAEVNQW